MRSPGIFGFGTPTMEKQNTEKKLACAGHLFPAVRRPACTISIINVLLAT